MARLVDKLNMEKMTIPSVAESEAKIAEEAPAAVDALRAWDAIDLAEALGLSNYLTKEK